MSEEEIKNFINKRKEIEKISIKSYIIRGSIPTSSKELSENDRNKIKKLLYTEDFTQSELADIFGVAQATISRILKIDREKVKEFLMIATPLELRTELFFNYGKLKFINDSKATNVDSTKFAIQANKNSILICGGYDKGVDLAPLAEMIKENIKEVYLIGVIADKIENELKKIGYEDSKIHKLVNIENSLQDMKKRFTKDSDEVILLSPATSSYDQFNSFEHRGKVFKELVLKIFG